MNVQKWIFEKIITSIIIWIITTSLTSIYSHITTGNWTNLLINPIYYYIDTR